MLDTNVISDLIGDRLGPAAQQLAIVGEAEVCTSIIVALELRFGAAKKRHPTLAAKIDAVLETIPVLAFEHPADEAYAAIRSELERAGTPLGAHDYLIAAHALSEGMVLVTANEREFRRVPGLLIENWLR
ncbi:MAG: type II toxin-antitoxin system VapC family toxin [Caulobacter sp.]|nr:type II toxin-antitoxin system VapC family toxin [Caulobacter sp.]